MDNLYKDAFIWTDSLKYDVMVYFSCNHELSCKLASRELIPALEDLELIVCSNQPSLLPHTGKVPISVSYASYKLVVKFYWPGLSQEIHQIMKVGGVVWKEWKCHLPFLFCIIVIGRRKKIKRPSFAFFSLWCHLQVFKSIQLPKVKVFS